MKATLTMQGQKDPVAVLDEVNVITFNDNHKRSPTRVTYKSKALNASKVMTELNRDNRFTLTLEDGRSGGVVLQHSSLDSHGNFVGVLRVIDGIAG